MPANPPAIVVDAPDFRCPFCGGKFTFSKESVIHTMPPCQRFMRLDPVAFLRAARKAGAPVQ